MPEICNVKFTGHHKQLKAPFVMQVDFESILKKVQRNNRNNYNESYNNKYQDYTTFSYGYRVVSIDDWFSRPEEKYWNEDAVYNFISEMFFEEVRYCKTNMKKKLWEETQHFMKTD